MDIQATDSNLPSPAELDSQPVLTDWIQAAQGFRQWPDQFEQLVYQSRLFTYSLGTNQPSKPTYSLGTQLSQLQGVLRRTTLPKDRPLVNSQKVGYQAISGSAAWSRQMKSALNIESAALGYP